MRFMVPSGPCCDRPTDLKPVSTAVYGALLDDINTPEAIAALHAAAKTLNKAVIPRR